MNCPECQLLEMRVEKVVEDEIHYKCKNCGKQEVINTEELEKKNKDA